MITDKFYIVFTLIVLHGLFVQSRRKIRENSHTSPRLPFADIDGHLLQQRCAVYCVVQLPNEQCTCPDFKKKPGLCPNSTNSILEKICLDECKEGNDYECPGTKVCCKQDCGYSCQDAAGLDTDRELPPIPYNVTISEHHCDAKNCEISWKIHRNPFEISPPIYYVVETRSHVGNVFSHRKLEKWQWTKFRKTAEVVDHELMELKTTATTNLKMGLWYQIRVAAINKYGFRGYSNYSHEYRLKDQTPDAEPKAPKPPGDLEVTTVGFWPNGTVLAHVNWSRSKSDLPIDRYKIRWSLYMNDISLYQNEDFIKEPPYELFDLRKDSYYYIQVQAISISGGKRLKSLKESKLLNTTTDKLLSPKGATIAAEQNVLPIQDEREIRFKFLPNRKYGMLVHVFSDRIDRSFNGSFVELCSGTNDCESKEYGAVRPRKKEIIFSRLKFNTEYTLRVIYRKPFKVREITKTFRTPHCGNFKKTHPKLNLKC